MTLVASNAWPVLAADGATTDFAVTFPVGQASIEVRLIDTSTGVESVQTDGVDYTLVDVGAVKTVRFATAPAATMKVAIRRVTADGQAESFTDFAAFPGAKTEGQMDIHAARDEEVRALLDRVLRTPADEAVSGGLAIPGTAARAGQLLGFDAAGQPLAYAPGGETVIDAAVPDYAALRALSGLADGTRIGVTNAGLAGTFVVDASDTTSTDDGGTVIVTADGKRLHRRPLDYVTPEMFGAAGDAILIKDAAMAAASATLTATGIGSYTVGTAVRVRGAAGTGLDLASTIKSVTDADTVVLNDAAAATVSDAECFIVQTDDTAAFRLMGTWLENRKGGTVVLRRGAIYRLYSAAGDFEDIWNITDADGFSLIGNGAILYADRDVRLDPAQAAIFPFQFRGSKSRNVSITGKPVLTSWSRPDTSFSDGTEFYGMRWFYFTGTGKRASLDIVAEHSVEGGFFQNTGTLAERWSDLDIMVNARFCTYSCTLAESGDHAVFRALTYTVGRPCFFYGVHGVQAVVTSRNHMISPHLTALHETGGDDHALTDIDLKLVILPRDTAPGALQGPVLMIENRGVLGATMENVHVDLAILKDRSGATSHAERTAVMAFKSTDGGVAMDSTAARGHVVHNCTMRILDENVTTDSNGNLADLFYSASSGNWTGESIEGYVLGPCSLKGAASEAVRLGLEGMKRGPFLVNINMDGPLEFGTGAGVPDSIVLSNVKSSTGTFTLVMGSKDVADGLSINRTSAGVVARFSSDTGIASVRVKTAQGGGNFAGALEFEDTAGLVGKFQFTADGQLRLYTGPGANGNFLNWDASGNYTPSVTATMNLGSASLGWLAGYFTDGIYVGGTKVVGSQQAAIASPSGGTTIDAQARTAIDAIRAALIAHGLTA